MMNLKHAAKAHDCRIIAFGNTTKRRYRFVPAKLKLKTVRAA